MMNNMNHFMDSSAFIPHGHCFLWIPSLLWLHVISDTLIGLAYVGIAVLLYLLVRKIRLPFSPVFIAFGLFIFLCGLTHFMNIWTIWNPDYWVSGYLKAATAMASVATAIGLVYVKPQVEEVVSAARLSEQRRERLETANAELAALYDKVKELDELKSEFFANISHELRTPLALILGPSEQLLLEGNLSAGQRRHIESIDRNAKTLVKQVNDLLDVSKLEAGKMRIQYTELDLASWFRLIGSQFEVAAEQRGLRYRLDAPQTLSAQVDPELLERVLINLLSNAFKFTPRGGAVTAELRASGDELLLSVSDTGPGVAPEQREVIFERFRQSDGGATRNFGGTGLGLAIVKDFVELHRGRVELDEVAGGGAKFTVALPLRAPQGATVEQAPQALQVTTRASLEGTLQELSVEAEQRGASGVAEPGRAHVLVVEDNADMRDFVADVLTDDYNVIVAADGQEGLERAEALRPDLILTDIMMPRLSGDRLVRELRQRPAFAAVPIVLLSAKADDELRIELLRDGAQDYINKPFQPQELKARVANLVEVKLAGDTLRRELDTLSTDLAVLAEEVTIKNRHLQTALDATQVAREQAERASQAKSYFLAMVSHEMRTPLSTVHMNLQLLLRDRGGDLPEPLRAKLERVAVASQQMTTIVEGLLEYTRAESGRIHAHVENVDLTQLAAESLEEHRLANTRETIEFEFAAPAKPLPPLHSDPKLLKVILDNLLANALKFTETGTITLGLQQTDDCVVVAVQDTGMGIPQDALGRIFEPFEQVEPVQRKSTPGMGLGLALVKQIAEALGGRVEVTSEPDVGSTFRVTLPIQARPEAGDGV